MAKQFNELQVQNDILNREIADLKISLQNETLLNEEQRTHIEILKEMAEKNFSSQAPGYGNQTSAVDVFSELLKFKTDTDQLKFLNA